MSGISEGKQSPVLGTLSPFFSPIGAVVPDRTVKVVMGMVDTNDTSSSFLSITLVMRRVTVRGFMTWPSTKVTNNAMLFIYFGRGPAPNGPCVACNLGGIFLSLTVYILLRW